jgi:hypothetical protein
MRLDDMTGSFRQPDVAVHFVLGVLSWSSSLAGAAALERARQQTAGGPKIAPERAAGPALELLLGIVSFDQTLRAALQRAAVEPGGEGAARGAETLLDVRLAR